jgi:hypothetical protein
MKDPNGGVLFPHAKEDKGAMSNPNIHTNFLFMACASQARIQVHLTRLSEIAA